MLLESVFHILCTVVALCMWRSRRMKPWKQALWCVAGIVAFYRKPEATMIGVMMFVLIEFILQRLNGGRNAA